MKHIKIISLGVSSVTALVVGFGVSATAHADVAESEANTKGTVIFSVDDSMVDPANPEVVDPNNPDTPSVPVDPGTDPEQGSGGSGTKSFYINWVSNFRFGTIDLLSTTMSAYALPTTLTWKAPEGGGTAATPAQNLAPFLQVTDNRGTSTGWNVTVTGTEFTDVSSTANPTNPEKLKGVSLFLNEAQIVGVDSTSPSVAPVALNAAGTTDLLAVTGESVPVFSADANKGQGTWSVTWGADATKTAYQANHGVLLSVPPTSAPKTNKTYQSTLTWTLSDTPAA